MMMIVLFTVLSRNKLRMQGLPAYLRPDADDHRVCFFVLCKRHWINRVPGAHRGDSLCIPFTLTLTLAMPSYL